MQSCEPGHYRIRLAGQLDPSWAEWFAGFELRHRGSETWLTGWVVDQAALHGLLARVRDLGVPLLSVARLPRPAQPRKDER